MRGTTVHARIASAIVAGSVALMVLVGSAAADGKKGFGEAFAQAIKSGVLERMLDAMPEDAWKELASEPAVVRQIAEASAAAAPQHAPGDPATWSRLVGLLELACGAIAEDERASADAQAALGASKYCSAQVAVATGGEFEVKQWQSAAEHFLAAHEKEAGRGELLEQAARILRQGASVGGDEALKARSLELCIQGARSYPSNPYFAAIRHEAELGKISALARKKRGAAKRLLIAYLADLEKGKFGTGVLRDTAHTRAVTFARYNKNLGVRAKYRTQSVSLGPMWMDLPKAGHWKKKGSRVYQYDAEGELIRSFHYTTYRWDTNYYLGNKTFGGDNIKGLARIGETDVLTVVLKVKHRRKVARTSLSRKIRSTVSFIIGGLDEDGEYIRYRWYYFQSEKKKLTSIKLSIVDYIPAKKLDPEAAFVIRSIREGR